MSLGKLRIAIPTKGHDGLKEVVSNVFGRANTFTIVDVEEGTIKNVKVLENLMKQDEWHALFKESRNLDCNG